MAEIPLYECSTRVVQISKPRPRRQVNYSVILSTVRCGTIIKGDSKNLDFEQKRLLLYTGGLFPDELVAHIQQLIGILPDMPAAVLKITGSPDAAAINKLLTLLRDDERDASLAALETIIQCAYEGMQLLPPLIDGLTDVEPVVVVSCK